MKEYFLIRYKANLSKYNIIDKYNANTLSEAEKEFLRRNKAYKMKTNTDLFYIAENKKFIN